MFPETNRCSLRLRRRTTRAPDSSRVVLSWATAGILRNCGNSRALEKFSQSKLPGRSVSLERNKPLDVLREPIALKRDEAGSRSVRRVSLTPNWSLLASDEIAQHYNERSNIGEEMFRGAAKVSKRVLRSDLIREPRCWLLAQGYRENADAEEFNLIFSSTKLEKNHGS